MDYQNETFVTLKIGCIVQVPFKIFTGTINSIIILQLAFKIVVQNLNLLWNQIMLKCRA